MKAMLTSSLGGSARVEGKRVPAMLIAENGLLDNLKAMWPPEARVLILSSNPSDYERNDSILDCLSAGFPMSGLPVSRVCSCDDRNLQIIEQLQNFNVLVLTGGHVPTQNRFFRQLRLKSRLSDFRGIVIGWSAGSMNCAETVYAGPELDGEAVDPLYERWLPGLGITEINLFPHYQSLKDDYLDGLRLIEDITFADSMGHEIIALNDGGYILVDGEHETLYGEAYRIKNGKITQICRENESVILK